MSPSAPPPLSFARWLLLGLALDVILWMALASSRLAYPRYPGLPEPLLHVLWNPVSAVLVAWCHLFLLPVVLASSGIRTASALGALASGLFATALSVVLGVALGFVAGVVAFLVGGMVISLGAAGSWLSMGNDSWSPQVMAAFLLTLAAGPALGGAVAGLLANGAAGRLLPPGAVRVSRHHLWGAALTGAVFAVGGPFALNASFLLVPLMAVPHLVLAYPGRSATPAPVGALPVQATPAAPGQGKAA